MTVRIINGDCRDILRTLPSQSVHCCVTSPPYFGLRDYGVDGQMGLEAKPEKFVEGMVSVFREVRRVLRDDGTLWLNLGDTYNNNPSTSVIPRNKQGNGAGAFQIPGQHQVEARKARANKAQPLIDAGIKKKDLIGIPWRVAFALQADGWYLRQDIIWSKPNPMPESVTDRCTKAHEYIFLLSKSARYHFDAEAIAEPASCGAKGSKFHTGKTAEHQLGRASAKPRSGDFAPNPNCSAPAKCRRDGFCDDPWNCASVLTVNATRKELRSDIESRHRSRIEGGQSMQSDPDGFRNRRSVWTVTTKPFKGAHFATFPPDLIEPCILAGCPEGGVVLDPFGGAGTTGLVADRLGRDATLIELNPAYAELAERRLRGDAGIFSNILGAAE